MKNFAFLIICLTLLIAGCKKYSADEHRSLKSPKKRIANKWTLIQFIVNGADSTKKYYKAPYQNDSLEWKLGGCSIEFTNEEGSTGNLYHFSIYTQSGTIKTDLAWAFQDNKNRLSFQPYVKSLPGAPYYFIFFFPGVGGKNGVWDIIKLTKDEMILELTNNNKKKLHVLLNREA